MAALVFAAIAAGSLFSYSTQLGYASQCIRHFSISHVTHSTSRRIRSFFSRPSGTTRRWQRSIMAFGSTRDLLW